MCNTQNATYPQKTIPAQGMNLFHLSFCKASAGRLGQKPIGPVNALLYGENVLKTLYNHCVFEQHEAVATLQNQILRRCN